MQSVSKFEIMFDVQGSFHKTASKWVLNLFCFLGPKRLHYLLPLLFFCWKERQKNMAKKIYHYKFFLNIWSSKNVLEMNFLL